MRSTGKTGGLGFSGFIQHEKQTNANIVAKKSYNYLLYKLYNLFRNRCTK